MARRLVFKNVEVAGPLLTLADLRWLVEECAGADDKSRVLLHPSEGNAVPEKIVVHALAESGR